MLVLDSVRYLILSILVVEAYIDSDAFKDAKSYSKICDQVTTEPYFEEKLVVGKLWRVYYAWNAKMDRMCVDVTFKRANPLMVNYIRGVMGPFLATQPDWGNATLLLIASGHRVLLLTDGSVPGRFMQVPHLMRTERQEAGPHKKQVKLTRMAMKILLDGEYLVLSECGKGITYLLRVMTEAPNRKAIRDVAAILDYGDGLPACARV